MDSAKLLINKIEEGKEQIKFIEINSLHHDKFSELNFEHYNIPVYIKNLPEGEICNIVYDPS